MDLLVGRPMMGPWAPFAEGFVAELTSGGLLDTGHQVTPWAFG
jgi:hypothetical protein